MFRVLRKLDLTDDDSLSFSIEVYLNGKRLQENQDFIHHQTYIADVISFSVPVCMQDTIDVSYNNSYMRFTGLIGEDLFL